MDEFNHAAATNGGYAKEDMSLYATKAEHGEVGEKPMTGPQAG